MQTLHVKYAPGAGVAAAALQVGVTIEKLDIADLEAAIAATTKADLKRVYVNLLQGSLNHLDAFESNLETIAQ